MTIKDMKIKYIKNLLCLYWMLLAVASLSASVRYDATFDIEKLMVSDTVVSGQVFTNLVYDDLSNLSKPGYPSVPVKYVKLLIPYNAQIASVDYNIKRKYRIGVNGLVFPGQNPVSADGLELTSFVNPADEYYKRTSVPNISVWPVSDGFLFGDNHILTLAISPIVYYPTSGAIDFLDSIEIIVKFEQDEAINLLQANDKDMVFSPVLSLNTGYLSTTSNESRSQSLEMVKSVIENKGLINSYFEHIGVSRERSQYTVSDSLQKNIFPPISSQLSVDIGLPVYEYCIVTTRELAPAFDRLVGWRKQMGYKAGVVCIEDILSNFHLAKGDLTSGINDDAGKLRAYLKYAWSHQNGTRFVLIGGDATNMPIRYAKAPINHGDNVIPTDLYFADLNGNWDKNKDKIYGEKGVDAIDFEIELFVGRLLCRSQKDVDNYIEKLIRYEMNPGNGDTSYLTNGLFTVTSRMRYWFNYVYPSILIKDSNFDFDLNMEVDGDEHPLWL